jgi:hypothetical protein
VRIWLVTLLATAFLGSSGCAYGFPQHRLPTLAPFENASVADPVVVHYAVVARDENPAFITDTSPYRRAFIHVLEETGAVAGAVESAFPAGASPYISLEITNRQSTNFLPHRLLSLLTLTIVPMWGDVETTLEAQVRGASGDIAHYALQDQQRIVIWLPLAVLLVPDVYAGLSSGEGNYLERFHRNLFRNLVANARTDGHLP